MTEEPLIVNGSITAKPIDTTTKRILKFLKFAFTIVAFIVTLLVFISVSIPVLIYGISGFVILAFCLAILAGLLWALLFMLRFLLPDFNMTFASFFDVNGRLNDNDSTR